MKKDFIKKENVFKLVVDNYLISYNSPTRVIKLIHFYHIFKLLLFRIKLKF